MEDKLNALLTDINAIRTGLQGNGMTATAGLAIGSTKSNVANNAFNYVYAGIGYTKAAIAAGTALSGAELPTAKSGAWALDIGIDNTIDVVPATDNATGYASAALAAAGLPAVAANHVRMGYVTVVNATGANFVPGTMNLDTPNTTVAYTNSTSLFNSLAAATAVAGT